MSVVSTQGIRVLIDEKDGGKDDRRKAGSNFSADN